MLKISVGGPTGRFMPAGFSPVPGRTRSNAYDMDRLHCAGDPFSIL
jgi:hypothetical protein